MNPKKSILAIIWALFITVLTCGAAYAEAAVPTKFPTAPILLYAGIFSAVLLALCIVHFIAAGKSANGNERKGGFVLPIILTLLAALAARIVLSLIFFGHKTDINCFIYWGKRLVNDGPAHFYDNWCDYPPGYMLILGFMSLINDGFTSLLGSESLDLNSILIKLPAMLADLGCAYLVYHTAKKSMSRKAAFVLLAVVAFTPVFAFVSGAWGQIDQVLALTLLVPILLLYGKKPILAGLVYGIGIIMKPQALMCGPLFAIAYFAYVINCWPFDRSELKPFLSSGFRGFVLRLLQTALAVIAALLVIIIVSIPFRGSQSWYWLIEKYYGTATSYDYATVNAYNFWALIGANWKSTSLPFMKLTYGKWGTIFMVLSVCFSILLYVLSILSRKNRKGPLPLIMAYMLTAIFTFGHYMHERYIFPAFILLIFAYIYYNDKRLLVTYFAYVTTIFVNCIAAFYYSKLFEYHLYWDERLIFWCSLANVALFVWFTYVTLDLIIRNKPMKAFNSEKQCFETVSESLSIGEDQ